MDLWIDSHECSHLQHNQLASTLCFMFKIVCFPAKLVFRVGKTDDSFQMAVEIAQMGRKMGEVKVQRAEMELYCDQFKSMILRDYTL